MAELASEHFDPFGPRARLRDARHLVVAPLATLDPEPPEISDWRAVLGRAIETEILPRLLLACRGAGARESDVPRLENELDLAEFVELLVSSQADRIRACVMRSARDRSPESVLLDVLAPAARRLGQLWESDERDFVDVTVGLRLMHDAIRDLFPDFDNSVLEVEPIASALFLAAPGERMSLA
jgi:hypothetical protein